MLAARWHLSLPASLVVACAAAGTEPAPSVRETDSSPRVVASPSAPAESVAAPTSSPPPSAAGPPAAAESAVPPGPSSPREAMPPGPPPIACSTDDDCWVGTDHEPVTRPEKLRGARPRPCKGTEHTPMCDAGKCIVRHWKC